MTDLMQLVVDSGIRMLGSGLTVETWGNISIRAPETGIVYLTPSGMPYDTLTIDDIVAMDLDGNIVRGHRKPTIESGMHLAILKARPDVNAVIHTHPIDSQVFALLHRDIPVVIDEAAQILRGDVKCTEYALPGSQELADEAVKALGESGMACLIANHGAVCVGSDIGAAFRVCTVLEMTAKVYYKALTIGEPVPISKEKVDYMIDFVTHHYGQGK